MKIILLIAVLVGGVSAASASDLPDCPTDENARWNNCFGTYTDEYGEYVGEFKDGAPNGQGTVTSANGNKYVGEWKDGAPNGQGTTTYANGNESVGEWKDNKRNGQGTLTYPSGTTYVGEFKDDAFNGQGTYTWPDGEKYVGEWKNGDFNGQGTYTYADGRIEDGIWEDDEFLGTVAELERAEQARIAAEEKAERIYNACLLDKGADVDMSVSSLEKALKATCASIAENPSFLENFRYN